MTWWCTATREPWSWSFRAYPGIWVLMGAVLAGYVWLWRRGRPDELTAVERRKPLWFGLGFAVLWGATDWPLGTLGAGYLASAHMAQYMLSTLVAAPLLAGTYYLVVPHNAKEEGSYGTDSNLIERPRPPLADRCASAQNLTDCP